MTAEGESEKVAGPGNGPRPGSGELAGDVMAIRPVQDRDRDGSVDPTPAAAVIRETGAPAHPGATGGEIESLTSIRGLAASWVVLLHFAEVIFSVVPESAFLKPFIHAGPFAVPLFFILSGYVLSLRYLARLASPTLGSVIRFWWLRIGRVYPVHACTLAITLLMVARHGWPTDEGHSRGSFIANCLLVQAWGPELRWTWNFPSWSLSSEWFAYLLFPLLALLMAGIDRGKAALLVVVTCALSAGAYAFEEHLKFRGLAFVLPTFVGGACLAVACPPGGQGRGPFPWAGALLLAAVALPYATGPAPTRGALYLVLFFALVATLGSSDNRVAPFWRSRPLVYLGEVSYSLYMTHVIVITLLTRFLPFGVLHGQPLAVRVAALFGCLVPILVAAIAMYHTIERPLRDLSRRRGSRPGVRKVG